MKHFILGKIVILIMYKCELVTKHYELILQKVIPSNEVLLILSNVIQCSIKIQYCQNVILSI